MDKETIRKVDMFKAISTAVREPMCFGFCTPCEKIVMAFDALLDIIEEAKELHNAEELARDVGERCLTLADLLHARVAEEIAKANTDKAKMDYQIANGTQEAEDDEEEDE